MIVLITPNCKEKNYSSTANEYSAIQPNVYMWLLAEYIKKQGIDCRVFDGDSEGYSNLELCSIIYQLNPKMVGVICMGSNPSSSTMTMVGVRDFFKEFDLSIPSFIWGGHISALPEVSLRETNATYAIVGEGYKEIVDLYNNGSDERVIYTKNLIDLKELPRLNWSLINPYIYRAHNWHCFGNKYPRKPYAVLWTSMGCPYGCDFCCVNNLYGKKTYRTRDMQDVIAEIDDLVLNHKVKNIKILDELFVINSSRIYEFCDLLDKRKYDLNMWCFARTDSVTSDILKRLKNVGMNWIAYGFDSVNQNALDSVHKNVKVYDYEKVIQMTKDVGINIIADVMIGFEQDDKETIEQLYEFLVKYNFETINLYPLFALPGTPAYKNRKEPLSWEEYSLYGKKCLPMGTYFLSPKEVLMERDRMFTDYISRPEYLDMIENKFGLETKLHLTLMSRNKIGRN